MFPAATASFFLIVASVFVHYEVLMRLNQWLPRLRRIPARARVLAAMLGTLASHFSQIALFAFAYFVLRDRFGLGGFDGQFQDSFTVFLYFSAETYTSLGLGDLVPLGPLRLVTGIESLTGLLSISWTASFTFLEMSRFWGRTQEG